MHPDKIRPSSYLDNLGNDWLAVDANGHVVARAATEDGVRRASPDAAAFFAGKDLKGKIAKAPAPDGDMHGGPKDGLNKALEAEKEAADKEAAEKEAADKEAAEKEAAEKEAAEKEAAEKEAAEKEAAEKKGTAGTATGPTGTNAGSATTGAGTNTAADTSGNVAADARTDTALTGKALKGATQNETGEKDPLDHDNNGKKGGSLPNTSRQRKPAGK